MQNIFHYSIHDSKRSGTKLKKKCGTRPNELNLNTECEFFDNRLIECELNLNLFMISDQIELNSKTDRKNYSKHAIR